ncbi:hypothetical protein HLH34_02725 [Gluconacetobacter azotocaptans]|uniref:Uncharacterized protein n=1 Tax=Gluconacetobacter azotocaptans TaxID=142834 RepID=A0A7W4PC63_9PROT|nr:hypothetical protein [Gluconacetobacter azotocaptans]MBB2188877.1 hypothetical protein [Gluconacetobacter azotocaptans]MBM9401646.1 hypothetical protein [Gluconacetobacter azotocaptans]GBQ30956.1 hypothetical protein AA13594_1914 [Gluconacetobacter azotocaptans DSM 13594]
MARFHPVAILVLAGLVAGGATASAQPANTSPLTHTPSAPSSPAGPNRESVPPSEKLPTWSNQKREQVSPTPASPGTQKQPLSSEQAKRRARHTIPGTNTVPGTTVQPRTTMPPQQ